MHGMGCNKVEKHCMGDIKKWKKTRLCLGGVQHSEREPIMHENGCSKHKQYASDGSNRIQQKRRCASKVKEQETYLWEGV